MISNAAAYYLWPTVWVGSRPPTSGANIDIRTLEDEVYRTTLKVGTSAISAKVLREGMFIFDFSNWSPGQALPSHDDTPTDFDAAAAVILQRVSVLNAHLACLYTALHRLQHFNHPKMVVSPGDIITLNSLDDTTRMGFGDMRVGALALTRYPSTYVQGLPTIFDWRVSMRSVLIEIDTVRESFQLLTAILQHPAPHILLLTDLYAHSCKAYENHEFALCLTIAWAITENLLRRLWERYIEANRHREIDNAKAIFISKKRKEKLTESRDFGASVISEFLSLKNNLPFPIYQKLDEVRQERNKWLHYLAPISRKIALQSVEVAGQMLNIAEGLNLEVPLVLSIQD